MSDTVVRVAADGGEALLLRPWRPEDAAELVLVQRGDTALRRWTGAAVDDEPAAVRWLAVQARGWERGDRFAFAVRTAEAPLKEGELLGHVVLKDTHSGDGRAEVGYWTAARARGRGVAPRALTALTEWAFGRGLTRLELLHQMDNTASCRVAVKCGYEPAGVLPAAPPEFPRDGHLHVRHA
ncbi:MULTISPECIES: GNAT family N-acetyltransferase [unclassified Streptomyces]|uniref:GNAT family N-acetyltransferase n=1 Tax=unclassified Streptomyces TaxID=2593676 RepID=UPI002E2C3D55|nr:MULTISPECIES: GNAT family N-acetyltransferase [unclassified Streptomyces]WUB85266.1 GNAT family N-acetyltransferase [Streptomyces sp. NBC_00566]